MAGRFLKLSRSDPSSECLLIFAIRLLRHAYGASLARLKPQRSRYQNRHPWNLAGTTGKCQKAYCAKRGPTLSVNFRKWPQIRELSTTFLQQTIRLCIFVLQISISLPVAVLYFFDWSQVQVNFWTRLMKSKWGFMHSIASKVQCKKKKK